MVLVLGTLLFVASRVRSVTVPLLFAFVVAYLFDPVVRWLEGHRVSRTSGILFIFTSLLLMGVLGVLVLGPQLLTELALFPQKLRELFARLVPWIEGTFHVELPRTVQEVLHQVLANMEGPPLPELVSPAGWAAQTLFGGTVGALGAVLGLLLTPIFAFFLLRDLERFVTRVQALIPPHHREGVSARFREIDAAMAGFIRGQVSVAMILAVLYSLGFLAVGLPLALLVGIVSGIGNMIPYLGTAVGILLATAFTLLDWHGLGHLLAVYAVFAVVQLLESWVITPKVVGGSIGLTPFTVIVAVLAFGELFGFFGILLAIPLAAIAKILGKVLIGHYRRSTFYLGR